MIQTLEERLARYPLERYPVQHATAQFHLGVALTNGGRPAEAESALIAAALVFADRLPVEYAKTMNALGAVFRMQGRLAESIDTFRTAGSLFATARRRPEEGAARYNLGLAQRDAGDLDGAMTAFREAADLFGDDNPRACAAAMRELGAAQLQAGDIEGAVSTLTQARDAAENLGDQPGLGGAANALGLAHLAAEHPLDAITAFRLSAAANPRSVRPAEYAMAKANLAVAYEAMTDHLRALLAAGQAAAVSAASEPVIALAHQVQGRLKARPGILLAVLQREPLEAWPGIIREELARWIDLGPTDGQDELTAWIDGLLSSERQDDLVEAWLGAVLELTPAGAEQIVRSLLAALAGQKEAARSAAHQKLSSGMARFHVPQWERLQDVFNRMAVDLGQEPAWT